MESSTELIDTGILRSSITYAVRMSKWYQSYETQ
jgi:hypothetical protein